MTEDRMNAMNSDRERPTTCADCGLPISGGVAECQTLFDELLAMHFTSPAYFGVHRLFVDAYCVQHPDRGCISFKSLAAHLAHLCWSLERGGGRAVPSEPIRRWVERHPHLPKPPLPEQRGTVTIAEVARATTPADHHAAVVRWAQATWDAYADLQPTARHWVDSAFANETHDDAEASSRGRAGTLAQPSVPRRRTRRR
jgi:hypothetical protein